ncbi:MAG: PAS domain S-box protein, partial [Proteobacteria bacterium]|nr:PAS domain S-box protein [Pseudomonadota bacterium]
MDDGGSLPPEVTRELVGLRRRVAELEARLAAREGASSDRGVDQESRHSRAELEAILRNLAAGIVIIDTRGLCRQTNDKFADMVGYPAEVLIGRPLMSLTHPDDIEVSVEQIEALKSGRMDSYSIEKRYLRRDDGWFWAEACVTGIEDDDGRLTGLVGVITDITERKQVEEALRRSQGYLEAMFTNLAAGVALVDADGVILRANSKFAEMMGYDPEELVGITLAEITHPDDVKHSGHQLQSIVGRKVQSYTIEKRYVRRDGGSFWAEASVTQIFGPDGRTQEFVGVITDIDRRKQAERKLKVAYECELEVSRTDPLTGLGNLKRYHEAAADYWRLCRAQARAKQSRPLSLILFDLDHFKKINDRHGHPAGDTCLKTLADRFGHLLRDEDAFCRVGGEEFAVLLPRTTLTEAQEIAERLRRRLEEVDIRHVRDDDSRIELKLTASFGVASISGGD